MKGWAAMVVVAALTFSAAAVNAEGRSPLEHGKPGQGLPSQFEFLQDYVPALPGQPFQLKSPKIEGTAYYYVWDLGGKQRAMLLDDAKTPRLYVDTDADNDLTDEEAVVGQVKAQTRGFVEALAMALAGERAEQETVFGLVRVAQAGPGGDIEFVVRTSSGGGYHYLLMEPAGIVAGAVELAGRKREVQIVDGDLNGRYDQVFDPKLGYRADWLRMDQDGSGQLEGGPWGGDVIPLPRMLKVADRWYSIKVLPDGSAIEVAEAAPAFGTLDVGTAGAQLSLLSDTGVHRLGGPEGKWQLPEGRYRAWQIELSAVDEKRNRWQMEAYSDTGKLSDFTIRGGETFSMPIGPPLTVKTEVTNYEGMPEVSIGLVLEGQAGEQYSPGATRNGSTVPAPELKILDEGGKVLLSSRFEYG